MLRAQGRQDDAATLPYAVEPLDLDLGVLHLLFRRCQARARLSIKDEAAHEHGKHANGLAKHIQPTITAATWKPTAGAVPEYCRVEGFITTGDAREGFGRVRFAVNLPTNWNERFVMLGDGGHDGSVSTSTARLNQGYATANLLRDRGSLSVTWTRFGDYVATSAELEASAQELFDAMARGEVRPRVQRTFPLEEAAEAHRLLESRQTTGSLVLTPRPGSA